jgi:hypothetical protein
MKSKTGEAFLETGIFAYEALADCNQALNLIQNLFDYPIPLQFFR